ncbi:SPOR domain-containing protein [Candidatus Nitrosacidococcus sp. I8]|uniref:SPOR domain-containing protein n=1 Tax=Candidatus Nitrosacidococcus sp. I8 TaxID=2942908 RepID=UPI002227394A|nr:SPOR domain-containing protein [Candidatus Nitrosacidococcus sp. I8]CAH9018459.1 hypothetical protein NURINAE_00934 [Candidatus Nitrosacidococcus sp. I8]
MEGLILEKEIKQRLIGALVLLGLGIITIPILLRYPSNLEPNSLGSSNTPGFDREFSSSVELLSNNDQNLDDLDSFFESENRKATQDSNIANRYNNTSPLLIQVGSFSHKENAIQIRDKAVSSGYKAFIESMQSGNQIIYKVRIRLNHNQPTDPAALKKLLEQQLGTKSIFIK